MRTRQDIPPNLAFVVQLRRTYQALRTRLDAELGPTGLTTPQCTALALLDSAGKASSSELARAEAVTAQTMQVLVAGLESSGLVVREPHPNHGRILLVSLTTEGEHALGRAREVAGRVQDEMVAGLSESERESLLRLLAHVERTLG